jgi:hypothetical protein
LPEERASQAADGESDHCEYQNGLQNGGERSAGAKRLQHRHASEEEAADRRALQGAAEENGVHTP